MGGPPRSEMAPRRPAGHQPSSVGSPTKARPRNLGEFSQPARRTDAERAGGMCGYRRTLGSCSANTRATAWRSVSSSEIGTTDPTDSMLAESKTAQHSKLAPKRLAYTMP